MKKTAAAALLPFATLSMAACSDTAGPEEGANVEEVVEDEGVEEDVEAGVDPYDGLYDQGFADEYDSYVGEEVTVSAEVNEIISPNAFTIAGTDSGVEELLIVHDMDLPEVTDGLTVAVTGTVGDAFVLGDVEDSLGVDFDDDLYSEWEQQRYIEASAVDASVNADPEDDEDNQP